MDTADAIMTLQGALECTDWDMFVNSTCSIDELVETIGDYINFCVESTVPKKTTKIFPNNKPWITKRVKEIINRKKLVYARKDRDQFKTIQKELRSIIRIERENYRRKIEKHFTMNNMKKVWTSMKLMSGYSCKNKSVSSLPEPTMDYADNLNTFYNRFNCHDFSVELENVKDQLKLISENQEQTFQTTEDQVRSLFNKVNPNKAVGPDSISPRILKLCSNQLAKIFSVIFNMCFSSQTVPAVWKKSCIVPVPKKNVITCMNDLRPVALTSAVMKVCERIVLQHLKKLVINFIDPLQFAYQQNRSTDDAILILLHKIYSHIDKN